MKKSLYFNIFPCLFALSLLFGVSCSEKGDITGDNAIGKTDQENNLNSAPALAPALQLYFVDANQKDRVQALPWHIDPKTEFKRLDDKAYTLTAVVTETLPKEQVSLLPISIHTKENKAYLTLTSMLWEAKPPYLLQQLEYTFACKALFGDDKAHRIVSTWKKTANGDFSCTSILFDDAVLLLTDTNPPLGPYAATIVLD